MACGTRESGLKWLRDYGITFPLLLDIDRIFYLKLGLRRMMKAAWNIHIFIKYAEAVTTGIRKDNQMTYPGDDLTVMGGDFIVESTGKLLYAHCSKEQYDRPEVDHLIEVLRQNSETTNY